MSTLRVEYPSQCLLHANYQKQIETAQDFCAAQGWTFGIQIHNTTPREWIESLYATGAPLSFHAPVCSEYFMNLANRDISFALESVEKSVAIMERLGGDLAVFHGFLMTDAPILAFTLQRSFQDCMQVAYRKELSRRKLPLCRNFFSLPEYVERLERVKERLKQIQTDYPTITWCIENDFPVYGGGLLLAEQMAALAAPLCLDISHLWACCVMFNKDFFDQVKILIATKQLRCVHIHASRLLRKARLSEIRDGHHSLRVPNEMELPELVRLFYENQIRHWVIETPEADIQDLQLLSDWRQ